MNPPGSVLVSAEARAALLEVLDEAIELAEQTGRSVSASHWAKVRDALKASS